MDYKTFMADAGLPEELEAGQKPEWDLGYQSFPYPFATGEPSIRLVTMSKDFALRFNRMSDEIKAKMMDALAREAKRHQDNGVLLTLDREGNRNTLVTMVSLPRELVLHLENR